VQHSVASRFAEHLPPHSPAHDRRALAELPRLGREAVGLVDEELNPLAPAEDGVDVARHDRLNAVQLGLGVPDRVARGIVDELLLRGQRGAGSGFASELREEVGGGWWLAIRFLM